MNDSERRHSYIPIEQWGKDAEGKERAEQLPAVEGLPPTWHRYDEMSLHAINVALAAGRPLLVRGEPGTGKSQLARAAAHRLGRQYKWRVMDAQTKISDLFYELDAVRRLAQAQVAGALCQAKVWEPAEVEARVAALLDERRFVRPGPLWWAFNAASAHAWVGGVKDPNPAVPVAEACVVDRRPYVVLIDEIDKTDPSVPNGLLEALGQGTFPVLGDREAVSLHHSDVLPPLIILTTNDERELPAAFIRRCLVYYIGVPRPDDDPGLEAWLVERGETHFPALSAEVRKQAAAFVRQDREAAQRLGLTPPGQAEYLDLLRAIADLGVGHDEAWQLGLLRKIKDLALKKHSDLHASGVGGRR